MIILISQKGTRQSKLYTCNEQRSLHRMIYFTSHMRLAQYKKVMRIRSQGEETLYVLCYVLTKLIHKVFRYFM